MDDLVERLRQGIERYDEAAAERVMDEAAAEIELLRAALEWIVRECDAPNKGPVAVMIAHEALGQKEPADD